MKKSTREELNRLHEQINDLNVMVYAIAQAAGVVPIRVPDSKSYTKWVRADSEEWKAEYERRKAEVEGLRRVAQTQQSTSPNLYNPSDPTSWGGLSSWGLWP